MITVLYCTAGTLLGEYEGELLNQQQYFERYPDGVVRMIRGGGGAGVLAVAGVLGLRCVWGELMPYTGQCTSNREYTENQSVLLKSGSTQRINQYS